MVKEHKINKYITMKLEGSRTNVYVNGEIFRTCMNLILDIPTDRAKEYNSIDDYVKKYGNKTIKMDPKQEFIGHCSNIQAWVENDYNTEILHRNIAFPLLRKLAEFDPIAKIRYKEEIGYRWQNGNEQVKEFLKLTYLLDLNVEELNSIGIKAKEVFYKNLYFRQKDRLILVAAIDNKGDFLLKKKFRNMKKLKIPFSHSHYSKETIYLEREFLCGNYIGINDIDELINHLREIEEMDTETIEKIKIEGFQEMFGQTSYLVEFLDHFANSFEKEKKIILKAKIKEYISEMRMKNRFQPIDYFAEKYYLQLGYEIKKILTTTGLIYCKNFKVFKQVLHKEFWELISSNNIKISINEKRWEYFCYVQSVIPVKSIRGFSYYFTNKYGKRIWNELDDQIEIHPINLCLNKLCKIIMSDYPIRIEGEGLY